MGSSIKADLATTLAVVLTLACSCAGKRCDGERGEEAIEPEIIPGKPPAECVYVWSKDHDEMAEWKELDVFLDRLMDLSEMNNALYLTFDNGPVLKKTSRKWSVVVGNSGKDDHVYAWDVWLGRAPPSMIVVIYGRASVSLTLAERVCTVRDTRSRYCVSCVVHVVNISECPLQV